MRPHSKVNLSRLGPGIALGLFSGRFLSEQLPVLTGQSLIGAIVLTLIAIVLAVAWLQKKQLNPTWPLLFLLVYVLSREPNPQTAVLTALFTLTIFACATTWDNITDKPFFLPVFVALTGIAFFLLYTVTLAPGILPADNGEFQLVAAQLGVAHPPGFSLYTLLAHLMTWLPIGPSPAYKVNLFSTITSVLTIIVVYLTVNRLTRKHIPAITAVLTLGTATTFWAQATTANIRSLTGLFAALMLYALVRFKEEAERSEIERLETKRPETRRLKTKDLWLVMFALWLGFGVIHHASLVFMGLVGLVFVMGVDRILVKRPQHWIRPFLAGLLGLIPLLYFPFRANAQVRGASPGLATLDGFINHVLALGFRGDLFYFIKPAVLWQRFQVIGNVLTFQFSPWSLLGMVVGLFLLLWHDRRLALLLGGSFALHSFITATYRAPQTVEYMLPAYVVADIALGYAVGNMDKVIKWQRDKVHSVFAALMLVTAVYQGWQHYPSFALLHWDRSARDYAQTLFQQAPAQSVILADWHWATPLWYLQEIEDQRPDVEVRFVFPEGEPYAQTWARRIAGQLADGRPVIATHFDENAYASLPAPEPLGDAFFFRQEPRLALPPDFAPLDLTIGDEIQLRGAQLNPATIAIGQEAVLTIAWQPATNRQAPVSLFSHLVGFDGRLYAQDDLQVQPQPAGITLTQFRLTPRLGAVPGEFAVMLGTPENSDARTTVATLTVTVMSRPPVTQNPVYRTVPSGRPLLRLVGYDWDNTLPGQTRLYLHWQTEQGYQTEIRDGNSPDSLRLSDYFGPWGLIVHNSQFTIDHSQFYVPLGQGIVWTGRPIPRSPVTSRQSLTWRQTFRSGRPVTHDLVISVRLIGFEEDGFHWAWWDLDDTIPALGAIPTLKWIGGSTVRSPHTLVVDAATRPGQAVGATLRLYDAFNNRPLPILDDRITNDLQLPWIPLGQTSISP